METCEVTFDDTMPCTSLGFECAGDEEMVEDLFEVEKDEAGDDDGENHAPEAGCVPTTYPTTTMEGGPSISCTTTVRQEDLAREAEVEGEVVSRREAPRWIQEVDPLSKIIGDIDEHTTQSKSGNSSHFAHATFVASFEPKDIGHALPDANWVNSMHEELENFERNQVWELVEPPPNCHPIVTNWVWKNKEGENGMVVRNKSRLVAHGYSQFEGIDYEETFAPVAVLRQFGSKTLPWLKGSSCIRWM
jgi:hypothetical protein